MQPRKIVFAGLAIAILGLIVLVFLKVRTPRQAEVSEDKLAAARAAHERAQAERPRLEPPAPPPPTDWEAVRAKKEPPAPVPTKAARGSGDEPKMPSGKLPMLTAQPTLPKIKLAPSAAGRTGGDNELGKKMDDVNLLYDRGEYDGALEAAVSVLEDNPKNIRMLRVAVSSACMMGEVGQAKDLWSRLPDRDKKQIAIRCSRYGVTLSE